jgi:hypothetical protein
MSVPTAPIPDPNQPDPNVPPNFSGLPPQIYNDPGNAQPTAATQTVNGTVAPNAPVPQVPAPAAVVAPAPMDAAFVKKEVAEGRMTPQQASQVPIAPESAPVKTLSKDTSKDKAPSDTSETDDRIHALIYGMAPQGAAPNMKPQIESLNNRAAQITDLVDKTAGEAQYLGSQMNEQTKLVTDAYKLANDKSQAEFAQQAEQKNANELEAKGRFNDISARLAKLDAQGIDPNHWWASRSTGQTIAGVIGLALGGYLQGQGLQNPAGQMIDNAIKNDLDAQKTNMNKNISLLKDRGELYRNEDERQVAELKAQRDSTIAAYTLANHSITGAVSANKDNADAQKSLLSLSADVQLKGQQLVGTINDKILAAQRAAASGGGGAPNAAALQARIKARADKYETDAAKAGNPISRSTAEDMAFSRETGMKVPGTDTLPSTATKKGMSPRLATKAAEYDADAEDVKTLQGILDKGTAMSASDRVRAGSLAHTLIAHGYDVPKNPLTLLDPTRGASLKIVGTQIGNRKKALSHYAGGAEEEDTNPDGLTPEEE